MKTRILRKLRKRAKREFKLEAFHDSYRIISYVIDAEGQWHTITMSTIDIKELAIKELFKYRRNFILNIVKEKRRERLNKELSKI